MSTVYFVASVAVLAGWGCLEVFRVLGRGDTSVFVRIALVAAVL